MSEGWIALVLVIGLALASVSVRTFVALDQRARLGRLVVIVVTATLGVSLVGTLAGWDYWLPGLVLGLAVVELGPTVLSVVRALIKRKGGDV